MNGKKPDDLIVRIDRRIESLFEKCPGLHFVRTGKRWKKVCVGLVVFSMVTTTIITLIQEVTHGSTQDNVPFVIRLMDTSMGEKLFAICTGLISFIPFVASRKEE